MKINGALFKNSRKEKENHPDYRGDGKDEQGREYWINGWTKRDKNGNAYLSVSLQDKQDQQVRQTTAAPAQADGGHDDLPF